MAKTAANTVLGYNIRLKSGTKTFMGVTSEDMTVTPNYRESITKDNAGQTQRVKTNVDFTFAVSGLVGFTSEGTKMDSADMIDNLLSDELTLIDFVYTTPNHTLSGQCFITSYSESSDSENEATYTLNLQSSGKVTKAEVAA